VIRSNAAANVQPLEDTVEPEECAGVRESTRLTRRHAVERVVESMRERVSEPLSLDDMAQTAMFSPYYFHRVFRVVTGVPPARFLSALRMAKACQLLLQTQMRVIDVCYEVGFGSLGTFTTRFARQVGAPPQQLRWLARRHGARQLSTLASDAWHAAGEDETCSVSGWVETPPGRTAITMVGLFPGDTPQGPPRACAVVRSPGSFYIESVPAGRYFVFAAGFPTSATVVEAALLDPSMLLVDALPEPVRCGDAFAPTIQLRLRPGTPLDPPIVLAAPLLVAEQALAGRDGGRWAPA
jgi:AraC-like DNA-binding protein